MLTGFILCSVIYVCSLAVIDGVFNRLVFRENRKLSYFSPKKRQVYQMSGWKVIGIVLLIVLPLIIPIAVSFALGGIKFVLIYLIVFTLIDWDIIFGKLVFDNWLGDTPSIALPKIGWKHIDLKKSILIRVIFLIILTILLLKV